ncbi:MAG TPA: AAA family ATPase [Candidatus Babeliales bacterium]|nr:AAA family ATPase [Candidatus Babeliales bacterium]
MLSTKSYRSSSILSLVLSLSLLGSMTTTLVADTKKPDNNVGRHSKTQAKDDKQISHDNPSVEETNQRIAEFLDKLMKKEESSSRMALDELCLDQATQKEINCIIAALKRKPKRYSPHGLLLYGPTGVGKTTLVRIIARETGRELKEACASNFVTMYQGSGAGNVRSMFEEVQNSDKPSILFIDEIEAIARTDIKPMNSHEYDNAVKTFWTELDRCKREFPHIFVVCACNDYENLDARVKRRFIKNTIKIDVPTLSQRANIIKYHAQMCEKELTPWIVSLLAVRTRGWSGSDLQLLIEDASYKLSEGNILPYSLIMASRSKIAANKKDGAKKDSWLPDKSTIKHHMQNVGLSVASGTLILLADHLLRSAASGGSSLKEIEPSTAFNASLILGNKFVSKTSDLWSKYASGSSQAVAQNLAAAVPAPALPTQPVVPIQSNNSSWISGWIPWTKKS